MVPFGIPIIIRHYPKRDHNFDIPPDVRAVLSRYLASDITSLAKAGPVFTFCRSLRKELDFVARVG